MKCAAELDAMRRFALRLPGAADKLASGWTPGDVLRIAALESDAPCSPAFQAERDRHRLKEDKTDKK